MERTYSLTAITLRGYALKEADKILVLMTREEGLKRVVAKGLRKPKNRIGGRLEPFRINDVMVAKGRSMDIVTQVDSLGGFVEVQRDYDRMAAALAANELLLSMLSDGDPQPEIFDLYTGFLAGLLPGSDPSVLLAAFELQFLDLLGYRPLLEACLSCERPIEEPGDVHGLHIEGGGVICVHCEGLQRGRVRRLSPGAYALIRALQDAPLGTLAGIGADARVLAGARRALEEYLSFRAERELKAQHMFDWQTPAPLA